MSYKLAIFDLDGTVLDTLDDLANAVNHTLEVHNMPTRTLKEIRAILGNGARNLIERSVPEGTDAAVTDGVFEYYKKYYEEHSEINTKPYDGVMDMLHALKDRGIKLAVLSNKPDAAVQPLAKKYFEGIFDYVSGEREGITRKPAPDGIYEALRVLDIPPEDAVFVGDSEVDIDTAKNAPMTCISVCWGFRDADFLLESGATRIVSRANELFDEITK